MKNTREKINLIKPDDEQKRVQAKLGMKLVLEDRIRMSKAQSNARPLYDTLRYIDKEYKNGFTVRVAIQGAFFINGVTYFAHYGMYVVRDREDVLFLIYSDNVDGLTLVTNEFVMMSKQEQEFHQDMHDILEECEKQRRKELYGDRGE